MDNTLPMYEVQNIDKLGMEDLILKRYSNTITPEVWSKCRMDYFYSIPKLTVNELAEKYRIEARLIQAKIDLEWDRDSWEGRALELSEEWNKTDKLMEEHGIQVTPDRLLAKAIAVIESYRQANQVLYPGRLALLIGFPSEDALFSLIKDSRYAIVIKRIKTLLENAFAEKLSEHSGNVVGMVFSAKNLFGWKDKTEVIDNQSKHEDLISELLNKANALEVRGNG